MEPELRKQVELAAQKSGQKLSVYIENVLKETTEYDTRSLSLIQYPDGKWRKDAILSIRLPEKMKQEIQQQANLAKVSVGEYIIHAVTGRMIVTIIDGKDILHQLSKIGTNLNQLTILAHSGKITCPDLEQLKWIHEKILKELIQLVKQSK